MSLMFVLELKHTVWKMLCLLYQELSFKFCMNVNGANPFICCYNISVVALPKCVGFSSISSGIFSNVLNAMILTFLRKKFAKDLA